MTAIDCEPVSEQQAEELLDRVKVFRAEWARFAVDSENVFKAFREKGDSFPTAFQQQYQVLV